MQCKLLNEVKSRVLLLSIATSVTNDIKDEGLLKTANYCKLLRVVFISVSKLAQLSDRCVLPRCFSHRGIFDHLGSIFFNQNQKRYDVLNLFHS